MGLGPDIWGPHGWKFIHFIALGYPKTPTEEDKISYKTFFLLIPSILPCSICSNHYTQNLKKNPLTDQILQDRLKLFNWTVDMHNEVNKSNDKETVDYDTALKLILNNFENIDINDHQIIHKTKTKINNKKENKKEIIKTDFTNYLLLFIALVAIIFYLYYIKSQK